MSDSGYEGWAAGLFIAKLNDSLEERLNLLGKRGIVVAIGERKWRKWACAQTSFCVFGMLG